MQDQVASDADNTGTSAPPPVDQPTVAHFRQILLWPVHLQETAAGELSDPAKRLARIGAQNPWREVNDEFTLNPDEFQERHYNEFVTFLPPVQRFLYGDGRGSQSGGSGAKPITVMRRSDITSVRVTLTAEAPPQQFGIAHIDLYFFYDIDLAILAVELFADDISLTTAQEILFRLGRAYPAYWDKADRAGHCPYKVEWLEADGKVASTSDYDERKRYLAFVGKHRAARIARHWEYVLQPMVPHHDDQPGDLRYRQLEYYRMPMMAYLAMRGDAMLTRTDYVRMTFASGTDDNAMHPVAKAGLEEFDARYCYDLHHHLANATDGPVTRYMTCGHSLVVTGSATDELFANPTHGRLNAFRHQHFLLFLICHFHKAALLMFSDRLAEAVAELDVENAKAVQAFRSVTRHELETFLRFSHRYWFQVVSNQREAHDLFALCRTHLEVDHLYEEIRQEIQEMSQYLENDASRRQNETMKRLTVVTTFGLIGTTVTGFLGMNLFAWADQPSDWRTAAFLIVTAITAILTFFTVMKSRQLSDLLDALSDETLSYARRFKAIFRVSDE